MKPLKQQVERGIGEAFVKWYNMTNGTNFVFGQFGADPPDLIYSDGNEVLPLEITTSYYDARVATLEWKLARHDPTAANGWSGINFDASLIDALEDRIAKKCIGTHDAGTVLVLGIYPRLTSSAEFEALKENIAIPQMNPFCAIYVAGSFPCSNDASGGYYCWKLSK